VNVTEVKFCGITAVEDAQRAVDLGAWAIGLILWPGSRRRCSPEAAVEIAASVRRRVEVVGVFVNPTLDEVARRAEDIGLTMLQLHGDEGPAFCAEAGRRTGCRVIKAVRVRSRAEIQALSSFHTDYHLLDSYVAGHRGGTGEAFAWGLARGHHGSVPMILSGGLTPENVGQAISVLQPHAVDVASGVEREPGVKDPAKLEAFMQEVLKAGPHAAPPRRVHAPDGRSAHARTGTTS
jgi:phosphoribosylanthranilate isomerase